MQGRGVFTWADGRRYEGEYFNDKKEGRGRFEWPDGRSYDGYWRAGNQEGVGIYYNAKWEVRDGRWQNGKRTQWISEAEFNHEADRYQQNI